MQVDILCTDSRHPVVAYLEHWMSNHQSNAAIRLIHNVSDLGSGDILFLVSCTEIIPPKVRDRYRYSMVLHASDLPEGRGWSPHIWSILEGKTNLTVSLISASDPVDTGAVWAKTKIAVPRTALFSEINDLLFKAEIALIEQGVALVEKGETPEQQDAHRVSYYRRRTPDDSAINPNLSLAEQFDILRVADPERYPAFFDLHGERYEIILRRAEKGTPQK